MIASRLRLPVIPIRLRGVGRILPPHVKIPRPGPVQVATGGSMHLEGESFASLAQQVENVVRKLG